MFVMVKRIWGYPEAANFLNLTESALRSRVRRLEIPHIRLSPRSVAFCPETLAAWLQSRSVEARGDKDRTYAAEGE